jgi:NAD(P)-dependent dehydrogenase (short-subunit alcohol dehydrogenase family)
MAPKALPLKGRTALITGASRGIGAAVAKRLAREGAHVVLVARTVGGLEEVDDAIQKEGKGQATLVPLDLKDLGKIDGLALQLAERFGKLDILVGNAAILGGLRPISHVTDSIWKNVMAVNVEANFRLLRALDGLLRKSDAPRAIFVTSGVTQGTFPYWGPYTISKVALEAMVKTYAAENMKTPIRANLVDPGVVRTAMRAEAMPGENPGILPEPESITDIFVKLAQPSLKESGKVFAA